MRKVIWSSEGLIWKLDPYIFRVFFPNMAQKIIPELGGAEKLFWPIRPRHFHPILTLNINMVFSLDMACVSYNFWIFLGSIYTKKLRFSKKCVIQFFLKKTNISKCDKSINFLITKIWANDLIKIWWSLACLDLILSDLN